MEHYKIWIDNLLCIPVKKDQENMFMDYLIQNKSYMGKRMIINALKKFYENKRRYIKLEKVSQYMGEYQE